MRVYLISQLPWFKVDYRKRYGQWAVISGSTDGIGLAMARELAERGHSIVVMGRNHEKLAKTKASLLAEPNVGDVETVCCDLSDVSAANIAHLEASLAPDTRDIGILINNAGVSPPYGRAFTNHDAAEFQVAINIGVIMYVQLTRMVLPGMLKRSRGLIVNVSSCLGRQPTPFMGVYPVVKRFVNAFSEQLSLEFAGKPIDVINLNTGATRTKIRKLSDKTPTAYLCFA